MMQRMLGTRMDHMQGSRGMEMPMLEMDYLNMEQASDLSERAAITAGEPGIRLQQ